MKAKKLPWVLAAGLVLGATVYLLIPNPPPPVVDAAGEGPLEPVPPLEAAATDTRRDLEAARTRVQWTAVKTVAGKNVRLGGGWKEPGAISGHALVAADGAVRRITATVEVAALWTESDTLTDLMRRPETGFFALDKHPRATFVSTRIRAGAPAGCTLSNATHTVTGNFHLNGIGKSITFPAIVSAGNDGLNLEARFGLNRSSYNCRLLKSPAGVFLGDADIRNEIAVTLRIGGDKPATPPEKDPVAVKPPVDISSLPRSFSQTIEVFQVSFDMVLVPGDPAQGVPSLYVGTREVTWDEFLPWADGRDVPDAVELAELRAAKLRPSPPYSGVTRGYGNEGFPALGLSRLNAEQYCAWLSRQTGRRYRLPDNREWEHVFRLGRGGAAPVLTGGEADRLAVYKGNSWVVTEEKDEHRPRAAGQGQADALGLYHVAGNVAEWVTGTGTNAVVRGGHFLSPLEELGLAGREVEEQSVWNKNYPQGQKSIWWYTDAAFPGFRVVCEP